MTLPLDIEQEDATGGAVRPSIPVLAWGAGCQWFGVVLAEHFAWNGASVIREEVWWIACVAIVAAILVSVLLGGRRQWGVGLAVIGLTAGLVSGGLYWGDVDQARENLKERGAIEISGVVSEDPTSNEGRVTVRMSLEDGNLKGSKVAVSWPSDATVPRAGQRVEVRGSFQSASSRDEWARKAHRRGEAGRLRVYWVEMGPYASTLVGSMASTRQRLYDGINRIPGDGAMLLQGMLLGDQTRLRGSIAEENFRTTGLSHLIAVSGGHLVIVAYLMSLGMRAVGVPRRSAALVVLVVCAAYVGLSGAQSSAVRSFVMSVISGMAPLVGRRGDSLSALSLGVIGLLLFRPSWAFSIGLTLSVVAVAGLIIFGTLAAEWARAAAPRLPEWITSGLASSVVAQVTTVPVIVPVFNMLSLIGPIANVLALPLVTASLGLGLVGGALYLVHSPTGTFILQAATVPMSISVDMAAWLAALPYAAIALHGSAAAIGSGLGLISVIVWCWWPKPKDGRVARLAITALLAGAVMWVTAPVSPSASRAIFLDVGQGDAILLVCGDSSVLIDAGECPKVLRKAVARHGVRTLDAAIITHDHLDHYGGLEGLVGVVGVERILVPSTADKADFEWLPGIANRLRAQVEEVSSGQTLRVGALVGDVLWPPAEWRGEEVNDSSVIIRFAGGNRSLLLTGDAESGPLGTLLAEGALEPVCVVKVPHHGSDEALSDEVVEFLQPSLAVISVGSDNRFGHPTASTLSLLREAGVRISRTDRDGDVTFCLNTGKAGIQGK